MKTECWVLGVLLLVGCGGGGGGSLPAYWVQNDLAVADLNGDGLADLVIARTYVAGPPPHPGFVTVYLQAADHTYPSAADYAVASDPWGLAFGQVDADDRPDIVVAGTTAAGVSLLLQDGANPGRFLSARQVATGGTPYAVAVADLNRDGFADLAVALQNSGGGATVLLQDPANPLRFQAPLLLPNETGAIALAVGELNQDGRLDIAVAGAAVGVFLQAADGSFAPELRLAAGVRPAAVAIADIDADGLNDLLTASAGSATDGSGASLSVLLQDPSAAGRFLPAASFPAAAGARDLAVLPPAAGAASDVAVLSLVYAAQLPSTLSLFGNRGDGSFAVTQLLPGPWSGNFLATGDLNADGLEDLIVNDGPQVFLQDISAPGTFAPGAELP